MSPKDEVKNRLRMILVADSCGLSPGSMEQMKQSIMKSLEDFVHIENMEKIDINVTTDPVSGTIYSVNVPVSRVKGNARASIAEPVGGARGGTMGGGKNTRAGAGMNMNMRNDDSDGITLTWSEDELNADSKDAVSGRFPFGA